MADFRVPPVMRPALELIASLSDDAVEELAQVLERNPRALLSRAAAVESAHRITSLSPEDAERVMEAVISLLFFKGSNDKSTADMLKEILSFLAKKDPSRPAFPKEKFERLEAHLAKLLELSPLLRHAKALSLATDCSALFTEARVLSDIRPVFSERVSDIPPEAVIMHSLRISYAAEGEEHQFYVYLDSTDLKNLQECVTRAIEKDKSLRSFLERAKTQIFETS